MYGDEGAKGGDEVRIGREVKLGTPKPLPQSKNAIRYIQAQKSGPLVRGR